MSEVLPDLRQLRAFVAVADAGSFTLAAKKLFLTQSAISHSMKALEDSLECRLLSRLGKKTVLTEEGSVLLKRCRIILSELEKVGRELDGLKHRTRLTDKRYWRLHAVLKWALRRKNLRGEQLEIILGHCNLVFFRKLLQLIFIRVTGGWSFCV